MRSASPGPSPGSAWSPMRVAHVHDDAAATAIVVDTIGIEHVAPQICVHPQLRVESTQPALRTEVQQIDASVRREVGRRPCGCARGHDRDLPSPPFRMGVVAPFRPSVVESVDDPAEDGCALGRVHRRGNDGPRRRVAVRDRGVADLIDDPLAFASPGPPRGRRGISGERAEHVARGGVDDVGVHQRAPQRKWCSML